MMDSETASTPEPSNQLYRELHAVIRRNSFECDSTVYEIIGALEAVKMDMLERLRNHHENEDEDPH